MIRARCAARRVWDSRGRPTVEAEVRAERAAPVGRAIAPAGASTGSAAKRWIGATAATMPRRPRRDRQAVGNGRQRARPSRCEGLRCDGSGRPRSDKTLDRRSTAPPTPSAGSAPTPLIAVSMAVAAWRRRRDAASRSTATSSPANRPLILPLPEIQIFGGGAHAGRRVDIQDFMVMSVQVRQKLRRSARLDRGNLPWQPAFAAGGGRKARRASPTRAASGRSFETNEQALDLLVRAIEKAGFTAGRSRWGSRSISPRPNSARGGALSPRRWTDRER